MINVIYKRVGPAGLVFIPWVTLTLEKAGYDTWCAYHGSSIYDQGVRDPNDTGFPSGGASLPSFSLVQTRTEGELTTFRSPLLDRCWRAVVGDR